jgi:hypothetical protein
VDKKLVEVKQALADKYMRLAKSVSSKVRRKKYLNRAESYRHQVEDAKRK